MIELATNSHWFVDPQSVGHFIYTRSIDVGQSLLLFSSSERCTLYCKIQTKESFVLASWKNEWNFPLRSGMPKKPPLEHSTNNSFFLFCTFCNRLFGLDLKIFSLLAKKNTEFVELPTEFLARRVLVEKLSFSCTTASPRHPRFIVSGELAYKFKLPASVRVDGKVQDTDKPSLDCSLQILSRWLLQIDGFSSASSTGSPLGQVRVRKLHILSNTFID